MLHACSGDDGPDQSAFPPDAGIRDATTSLDASGEGSSCATDGARDDAEIALGLSLVKELKCMQCHGSVLSGNNDGVPSPTGTAYPPNLTPDPTTGLGCWSDSQIENAFLHGIDDQGQPLCPPMPLFGDAGLDAAGAEAIVSFLRRLAPIVNQVPNTECPAPVDAGEADAEDAAADGPQESSTGDAGTDAHGSPEDGGSVDATANNAEADGG
jgi:hypothetical protein